MSAPLLVPLKDYVADSFHAGPPSLSASLAHTLLTRSPRHAWYAHPRLNPAWTPRATEETDLGTIAHALLLEGTTERVVVIEAADWRTKTARQARDTARAEGKLPILADRLADVTAMVTAARESLAASELAGLLGPSDAIEATLLWQEETTWCRARPDVLALDRNLVVDYKTTSNAEPEQWAKSAIPAYGYDLQAAFVLRGLRAQRPGMDDPLFVFMVQETAPPHGVSFVALGPEYVEYAEHRRALAVRTWAECLHDDRWPGYPRRIAYVEPPAWAIMRWDARPETVDDDRLLDERTEERP